MTINLSKLAEIARFPLYQELFLFFTSASRILKNYARYTTFPLQELTPDIGQALCELLDGKNSIDAVRSR